MYSDWVQRQKESYCTHGIDLLLNGVECVERAVVPTNFSIEKSAKWKFAVNFSVRKENLESCIHVIERIATKGRGRPTQFIPIRFIHTNKLSKHDRLLLAFDAFVLSEMLGRNVSHGKIIHGDNHKAVRARTSAHSSAVKILNTKIAMLLSNGSPPNFILNLHCIECDYHSYCREKAIEKDDLSLLGGMSEKDRKKFNCKGIFTVSQLSYTFRPRRRPKRMRNKPEKYNHSLKALAIRENKIYIVGSPELKIEGTPVYLDVEGLPDTDFYYLIGLRYRLGNTIKKHSLWADKPEDEEKIWEEFINILKTIKNPVLIHYGSYETDFLKRMWKRYGELIIDISKSINLLSLIYAQIYFPVFSNSLKDVARFLKFRWTDSDCSGLISIAWRYNWTNNNDNQLKTKLIRYNEEDCEALELVTDTVLQLIDNSIVKQDGRMTNIDTVHTDSLKRPHPYRWEKDEYALPDLEHISHTAYWDYQRDKVYVKNKDIFKRLSRARNKQAQNKISIDKVIERDASINICDKCNSTKLRKLYHNRKVVHDLKFGQKGITRWSVKHTW